MFYLVDMELIRTIVDSSGSFNLVQTMQCHLNALHMFWS